MKAAPSLKSESARWRRRFLMRWLRARSRDKEKRVWENKNGILQRRRWQLSSYGFVFGFTYMTKSYQYKIEKRKKMLLVCSKWFFSSFHESSVGCFWSFLCVCMLVSLQLLQSVFLNMDEDPTWKASTLSFFFFVKGEQFHW